MTDINQNTVRQLTEKFFNASISDREMSLLSECARNLTGDNPSVMITDRQLLDDLKFIALLDRHSDAALQLIADTTPAGLRTRLDNHISGLARSSRRHTILTRILPAAAAAAVVLIFLTTGIIINSDKTATDSLPPVAKADTEATANNPAEETDSRKETTSIPESLFPKECHSPEASSIAQVKNPVPSPGLNQDNQQGSGTMAIPADLKLPSIPDPLLDIKPMITSITIDPSALMIQPLSTLSQTVCNVYESVDIVSSAFADIAETIDMVNSSLAMMVPSSPNIE